MTVRSVHVDRHLVEPEAVELAAGEVLVFSARCPSKSGDEVNEDGAAVLDLGARSTVLCVADGLGGHPSGEHASELAIAAIERAVKGEDGEPDGSDAAILSGFEAANRAVRELGVGAATTLVVAVVDRGILRTFNVGDSGVLVFGGRGRVKLQTPWHSPVGYALSAGLIDEDAAMQHADRHLISNVVGDEAMRVEVGAPIRLAQRDTIVLATDGLFDNLTTAEIGDALTGAGLAERTRVLIDECRERMRTPSGVRPSKPDDLTLVVMRPGGGG